MRCRDLGFAVLMLLAGVVAVHADEAYHVIPAERLPQWWVPIKAHFTPPHVSRLADRPDGCAAIALRIESDGTPHQFSIIRQAWTPMSPMGLKMLDRGILDMVRSWRFQPGPRNPGRLPVYTYTTVAIVTSNLEFGRVDAERSAGSIAAKVSPKCAVPDFVARVARATQTPMATD